MWMLGTTLTLLTLLTFIYLVCVFVYSCMCTHVEVKEQLGWAPYTMGSRDRTQVVRLAASTFSC